VKSLLAFAHRVGYVAFDVGAPVKLPPVKATLGERIMDEAAVHRMLALEQDPRNHVLLRLLYLGGLRISEICGLTWRDLVERGDAGQVTVFGKGGKTRVVLLQPGIWRELTNLRLVAAGDEPVFRSRKGGALDASQVHRIVKAAAARAGLPPEVSAHWLRHAHASHALDRGAPISLDISGEDHARARQRGDYRSVPARAAKRQQRAVSRWLIYHHQWRSASKSINLYGCMS
jgi:integrase/recombinase XerD